MVSRLFSALAVVLALASPARAEDGWPLHLALGTYMTLNSMDLAQTMYCVGAQQCREANLVMAPLQHRPAAMGAIKMGADSAAVYAVWRIHRTHPKIAWAVTALGIAVETYAVVNNATYVARIQR